MDTKQQRQLLNESLLKLQESKTTPKKALNILPSCFELDTYKRGDKQLADIFLAYMKFLKKRRPSAILNGIWEDILEKATGYCS